MSDASVSLDEAVARLAERQHAKDVEFMMVCATLADGMASVREEVKRCRQRWLEADHSRLQAIVAEMHEATILSRTQRADTAKAELDEREAYYLERLKSNCAYIREAGAR